ncbi:unnamed protein product, partial [Polarella glacialis]
RRMASAAQEWLSLGSGSLALGAAAAAASGAGKRSPRGVAARAAASSSGARSGDRELECWAYFATQREWCDHVLLYSDGTYKRAHLGGGGTWRLYVPDGGSALLLELDGLGKEGPLVFVSPDGGTDLFEAGTSELRHVSGPAAPLGVDQ